jgi:hypothetical protein
MKFGMKYVAAAVIALAASQSFAAEPVISLSSVGGASDRMSALANRGGPVASAFELDFIAGEKGAAVVQFDVVIETKGEAQVDLAKCGGSSLAGSDHQVFCRQISANRIRILVDSPTNSSVPTSSFGTIVVTGGRASIEQSSVVVGDSQGQSMNVEVL